MAAPSVERRQCISHFALIALYSCVQLIYFSVIPRLEIVYRSHPAFVFVSSLFSFLCTLSIVAAFHSRTSLLNEPILTRYPTVDSSFPFVLPRHLPFLYSDPIEMPI